MMGVVNNIDSVSFPKQGGFWGRQVRVCFNYDTSKTIIGLVVRDDAEAPGVMIIKLDDGRHVLSSECMWQYSQPKGGINEA